MATEKQLNRLDERQATSNTVKRLIDANELKKKANMNGHTIRPLVTAYHMCVSVRDIDNAPTVEAVEVVHGRWLQNGEFAMCSECTELFKEREVTVFRYCPECGAKMDVKENEST